MKTNYFYKSDSSSDLSERISKVLFTPKNIIMKPKVNTEICVLFRVLVFQHDVQRDGKKIKINNNVRLGKYTINISIFYLGY